MKKTSLLFGFTILIAACSQPAATEDSEASTVDSTQVEQVEEVEPSLTLVWETDTVLTTNESVLYDLTRRELYVSNIDGKPTDKDGKGFISKLDLDGVVTELKWAKDIDAPKGMGILVDKMYVTNIDELVQINMADGKITKGFTIKGAKFLNDVAVGGGKVYFSDMETGKLHMYDGERISLVSEGHSGLNGLTYFDGNLYGLDASGLIKFSLDGGMPEILNSEVTGGDGLVLIDKDTFIASRWKGEVWLIKNGTATMLLDSKEEEIQTADIGYNPAEKMVYVPRFFSNKVSAYRLTY